MTSVCTELCYGVKSCQQRHWICAARVYGMFSRCSLHLVCVCVCWSSIDLCVTQLQQRNNLTPKWYTVISCKKSTLACARYSIENYYRYVCECDTEFSIIYECLQRIRGTSICRDIFWNTVTMISPHTQEKVASNQLKSVYTCIISSPNWSPEKNE